MQDRNEAVAEEYITRKTMWDPYCSQARIRRIRQKNGALRRAWNGRDFEMREKNTRCALRIVLSSVQKMKKTLISFVAVLGAALMLSAAADAQAPKSKLRPDETVFLYAASNAAQTVDPVYGKKTT